MEQMHLHKQRLYSLIAAGIALVALLLPWITVNFMGFSNSVNGLRGWGILSLLGVIGVGALTFLQDKTMPYDAANKKYVTICFGAIALGALLFLLRKNSMGSSPITDNVVKTGFGLWLCLLAGLAGIALLYGFIKINTPGKTI